MSAMKELDRLIIRWHSLHKILFESQDENELDSARDELTEVNCELAAREVWLETEEEKEFGS